MTPDTYVLGLNYRPLGPMDLGHHPSATLLKNGEIVAMCEEERFNRVKEAPGHFPLHAIRFCLQRAGITVEQLSAVGWNRNPERAAERNGGRGGGGGGGVATTARFALRHTPMRAFSHLSNGFLPEKVTKELKSQLLY